MIFALTTTSFAASNDKSLTTTQSEKTTIQLPSGSYMEIIVSLSSETRALDDGGSFLIKEFTHNELTHTVQGSFGGDQLICTDYTNGQMVNRKIINVADRVTVTKNNYNHATVNSLYRSVLGRIVYNRDIGNTAPGEELTVYSEITNQDSEAYTINGALSDTISDIAGVALSVLSAFIPTVSAASKVAVAIVSYFGGNIAGGAIGVIFTEEVSVDATYYTLTGYHAASNYYTAGYDGVEKLVKTHQSNAYNKWFYEGYTPHTWKDGDDLASILWAAVFARPFPYVYAYR